jgi:GNAT superfamily N-acetyltransferase
VEEFVTAVLVERAVVADAELLAAIRRLLPQLSSSAAPIEASDLETIVASSATELLVARDEGVIVGVLTLVLFRIPTGVRARVEDVVVDEGARRTGAGRALVAAAIALAEASGARTIDLTSRPERVAPHGLYGSMGFAERATTVYRYDVGGVASD